MHQAQTPGPAEAQRDYFISDDDRQFEPMRTFTRNEDIPQLAHLASLLSRSITRPATQSTANRQSTIERKDTLAGLEVDDPVFDPSSPSFDFYKWVRMFMKQMEVEGVKHRRAGFTFKNLNVTGTGSSIQYQSDISSIFLAPFRFREKVGNKEEKKILRDFNGCIKDGEMLIVLGKPGSGCTTFLKTMTGETRGLRVDEKSVLHYNGIPQDIYKKELRGDVCYNAENDQHFPHLTVGETLEFAAKARTPQTRVRDLSRNEFARHVAAVVMTIFGLSHTYNTKVGNDYVRGVSGGERKRVSIAEMALSGSPICCWDNSTRGLDAATALEFTRALRVASNVGGATHAVAIYQASQAIYDLFDKAVVLYEGRQIYFGPTGEARKYFEDMGYECPTRQTTGDFLTSVTNPSERKARAGFEDKVPRTPDEFERYWKQSDNCKRVLAEIDEHEKENPVGGSDTMGTFREAHHQAQAKHVRPKSPYVISIPMQIKLCTVRAYQRLWNDKTSTITIVFSQIIMSLIIGSIFYGTPNSTAAFFSKGSILFFAILLSALNSITEINGLYEQRPIVERHVNFAFYHAFSEAIAGIVSDIPIKFLVSVFFNIILYFLGGLRYEPGNFFLFYLFTFITGLTMSAIFRTLAAATKQISQALAFAGIMVLAIVIYTGFTIQRSYMHPWFKWISWINPVAYGYEGILMNEVHGVRYQCATLVPPYGVDIGPNNFACAVQGAVTGETTVLGDSWADSQYGYRYTHVWRNLGFLFAFLLFFWAVYITATELNFASASSGEFLVFRRGHVPSYLVKGADEETTKADVSPASTTDTGDKTQDEALNVIPAQKDVFTWRNVVYDIQIKGEPRRLLDHVSGWVKPGTLTALMGVSGAGKTTLLDVLAQRTTMGVITGDMLVNGKPLDASFQRKTGYVQQQDLHLETTTVREALRFSAMLRQPKSVSKEEKYAYVEDVIKMLKMEDFSDAVVGNPGEGLNVEQRKLLTIGVELAAKPALLLFLDEPTSGLDSQSSWGIVAFLRTLADNGQAVLATIHQPSAILFQEFDRLLFLAKGGKTVYFGDIGHNSRTLLDYFEGNGARSCGPEENPAEFMLETVGAGPGGKPTADWPAIWKESEESKGVQTELDRIHADKAKEAPAGDSNSTAQFAMPFSTQVRETTIRVFQQYWRTPTYIVGKVVLCTMSALFVGFSFFQPNSSSTGLQNSLFSIFMMTTTFSTLVQQVSLEANEARRPLTSLDHATLHSSTLAVRSARTALEGI